MIASTDFWPALKDRLEKLIASRSDRVLTGKLTFPEYQITANEIAGLRLAMDEGDDLAKGKPPKAEETKPST